MFANCEGATDEDWQKVVDNMGLVYHCLNRMGGFFTDRDREDAEQDGIFGLLRAAQKYDPGTRDAVHLVEMRQLAESMEPIPGTVTS